MALRLALALLGAVIPLGKWVVITPGEGVDRQELTRLEQALERSEKIASDYLDLAVPKTVTVRIAPSSGDFAVWTGCSIWQGAAVSGGELVVQPLDVLERRGILEETLVHEYVHLMLAPYNVPLWLNEGLAVLTSGQIRTLSEDEDLNSLTTSKVEVERLLKSSDTLELKRGYLAASLLTRKMIKEIGRDSLVRLIKEEAL